MSLLLTLGSARGTGPSPGPASLISQWVVDDLTLGIANSESWFNRVNGKPALQRGDGIGKTRVVETSAIFNNHKVINNTHASGNRETEWTDGEIKADNSDYTVFVVANIDGFDAGADSSLMEARDSVGAEFAFIWRATRTADAVNWSHIYTKDSPAWNNAGVLANMDALNTHVYTLCMNSVTGDVTVYVDNTLKSTYSGKWDTNYKLGDQFGLCGSYSNVALTGLYGRFAEGRVYEKVLSADDRDWVINSLKTTYGVDIDIYSNSLGQGYINNLEQIYIGG